MNEFLDTCVYCGQDHVIFAPHWGGMMAQLFSKGWSPKGYAYSCCPECEKKGRIAGIPELRERNYIMQAHQNWKLGKKIRFQNFGKQQRIKEFWNWLAAHMPKQLILWCAIVLYQCATSGKYNDSSSSTLTFIEVIERWTRGQASQK